MAIGKKLYLGVMTKVIFRAAKYSKVAKAVFRASQPPSFYSTANSHNNVASIQKNRGDEWHHVIACKGHQSTVAAPGLSCQC